MDMIFEIILTLIIGMVAGFIGSIAGGGGLVSIPFLMFLGLPPQVAIATNKFGSVGLSLGAMYKFITKKKVIWKYVLPFSILSITGGLFGAKLLIDLPQELLTKIVGVVLLLLLPVIFIKDIGVKKRKTTRLQKSLGIILYFLLMIFGGFFGGGAGTLIFYCLMFFMGFTIIQANATDIIPWFLLSLSTLIFFMFQGVVDYYNGIALFFGMLIGSYFGAHTAIKKGNKWVRIVFALVVVASGLKILFA